MSREENIREDFERLGDPVFSAFCFAFKWVRLAVELANIMDGFEDCLSNQCFWAMKLTESDACRIIDTEGKT